MAYNIQKISPLDLKPSTAIGVSIPFSAQNVFSPVYTTKEQIKYNLVNFMLTDPRERIFDPFFGSGLRSRLFEQIDLSSFEELKEQLLTKLQNYFPQLEITSLDIVGDPEYHSVNVKVSYVLRKSNDSDQVSLVLQTA